MSSVGERVEEMVVKVGGHLLDNLRPGTDLTTVSQLRLCSGFLCCLLELLRLGGEEEGRLALFTGGLLNKILENMARMLRSREERARGNIIPVMEFIRASLTGHPSNVSTLRNLLRDKVFVVTDVGFVLLGLDKRSILVLLLVHTIVTSFSSVHLLVALTLRLSWIW